jgi:hypothetical protein
VVNSAGGGPASISAAPAHVSSDPIALAPLLLRAVCALLDDLSRQRRHVVCTRFHCHVCFRCEVARLASRFVDVYRVRLAEAVRAGTDYDKVTMFLRENPAQFVLATVGPADATAICCATPGSAGERDLLSVVSQSIEEGATAYESAQQHDEDDAAHARDRKGGRRVLQNKHYRGNRHDAQHSDASTDATATTAPSTTTTTAAATMTTTAVTDGADASTGGARGARRDGKGARGGRRGGRANAAAATPMSVDAAAVGPTPPTSK